MPQRFGYSTIFLLIFCFNTVRAQQKSFGSLLRADLEAGGYVSSGNFTPFWLRTNQFGAVPLQAPAAVIQGNVGKSYVFYDSLRQRPKKFDWGFAFNPVLTFDKKDHAKLLFPEAHVKIRFKAVELYAGRRKELMGLGDSTLSSGFYSVSGNSLPIPKIQIGTIGFTPLRFTGNFVAIHAGFAHGWFGTDYIQGVRLHQKFLYFRLGKEQSKSKFFFGLNHNVLWAGHAEYLKRYPELALNGELPSSWKFYPNVVLAFTSKNWFTKNGYGAFDSYRLGNHLGSYDLGFETKINGRKLWIYHQHPFEDVSSMLLKNVPDGLYGINLSVNSVANAGFRLTRLTMEFLTTKDQSGATFYIPGSKFQGADNYFNHTQYSEGWSYYGRTVGTPFIVPGKDTEHASETRSRYFPDNRVNMWYLGAQGLLGKSLMFTLRTSFSRNFGTPGGNFTKVKNQFSSMISARYALSNASNTSLVLQVATDQGKLFGQTTGGYLGIRKSW
ncbi:capsule assembly Wzi family protein [Dyadobacter flavalbus]|uniref:Capsule assembly Wzi family protein n=1 Tax=Dyadobacter flavalbus TaxID=2579942 RepID=A0A5M8Q693_9BACT|nr:capsule assembly Wzi family protein [Dyadobacter flavalbus]KAA6430434.1 capsule assembly Wzi family protein [Dyadobacter flavalbus]